MSGSRKWMVYTADDLNQYAVNVDESNCEASGFEDYSSTDNPLPVLPKGFQMRYVNCIEPSTGARRKIYVGEPSDDLWTGVATFILLTLLGPTGLASALTTFQIVSAVGEKFRRPVPFDTGLLDGDAT